MSLTDPRLITTTPSTASYYHYDAETGGFTVEEVQDAQPIIEENKLHQGDNLTGWKSELHRVASIPLVIFEQLRKDGYFSSNEKATGHKKFRKWLNDPNHHFFRTRAGKV